ALLVLTLWVAQVAQAQSWFSHLGGPAAAAQLNDRDPALRVAAARALGERGEARHAVLVLLARLEQEDSSAVRRAIMQSLLRRGDPFAVRTIAAQLTEW